MKKSKSVKLKISKRIVSSALAVGIASSQSACVAMFHQPKVPHGMKKFLKKQG